MYKAKNVVTSAEEIKEILGKQFPSQVNKVIDHIDVHCRAWIERSPFVVISSTDGSGSMDVSPKGDPPGFVKVLDQKTLAIPDRIGNNRADTFRNVIENPKVGLMFVIPKRTEVVRVGGFAQVVKDPDLLADMVVNEKTPKLALIVRVEEAMFHCGKSMIRSRMWQPEEWSSTEGLPTYGRALKDHGGMPDSVEDLEAMLARNQKVRLY